MGFLSKLVKKVKKTVKKVAKKVKRGVKKYGKPLLGLAAGGWLGSSLLGNGDSQNPSGESGGFWNTTKKVLGNIGSGITKVGNWLGFGPDGQTSTLGNMFGKAVDYGMTKRGTDQAQAHARGKLILGNRLDLANQQKMFDYRIRKGQEAGMTPYEMYMGPAAGAGGGTTGSGS